MHWQRFLFVPLSGTVWGYSLKENLQLLSQTSTASRGAASCFCRAFKVLKVQLKWQLTRATHKCGLKCSRWDARSRNGQRQRRPERSSWGTSHHKQHNIRARIHQTPLDRALIHSHKLKSKVHAGRRHWNTTNTSAARHKQPHREQDDVGLLPPPNTPVTAA